MIKSAATAIEPARDNAAPVQPLYLEALTLVERLHRRLLDVIKDEFDRRGRADINPCRLCCSITSATRN
jgi:hypothetical protein